MGRGRVPLFTRLKRFSRFFDFNLPPVLLEVSTGGRGFETKREINEVFA